MTTKLQCLINELDDMVSEFGFLKTCDAVTSLYEKDIITATECKTVKFQLAHMHKCPEHTANLIVASQLSRIPDIWTTEKHNPFLARMSRHRVGASFENTACGYYDVAPEVLTFELSQRNF